MLTYLITFFMAVVAPALRAQTIDAAYAKALQQKYPSVKSGLCAACKLWVNPYFKSIADTLEHRPLVTYYVYTQSHRLLQERSDLPRTGTYAAWRPGYGQPNETTVYKRANRESPDMIAKGHCQAWILLAWCADAAILSDTYTFNAAMEYQGQNIGTELATEELCRELAGHGKPAVTDSVHIWCGTFGNQHVFDGGEVSDVLPAYYYKIIVYRDRVTGQHTEQCYWLPNKPDEARAKLTQRLVSHAQLVASLGYDPEIVFKPQ
jgi:hypothetical protein